jgi:hypothetical protein
MSLYEDELTMVKEADDDLFPNFLFNPLFNDFDDDYYKKSMANDELITSVKKLRRRYTNFFDYMEALEIYNEYMDKLVEKYGGMKVIKNALKVDAMPDPVPAKPRLKDNRKNRQFLRSGIVPSRQITDNPISEEEILAIARQAFPNASGENVTEDENSKKLPKDLEKRISKMQETMAGRNRKQNLYRSVGNNSGTDFIVEYLNQAKRGVYDHSGRYTGEDKMSIMDIVKEQEKMENTIPELLDDELANQTEIVNGRLVKRKDYMKIQIYKELFGEGIDIIGNFGKSMSKQAVKMVRSQIGDTEPASKKELKKIKKRTKKERKMIERRKDSDRLLEKTLLGNKFSFESDGSNLSFRLKDIYKD